MNPECRFGVRLMLSILFLSGQLLLAAGESETLATVFPKKQCVAQNFPIDTLRDTIAAHPYYKFVQYYDSCRVTFTFGEIQLHRTSGTSGYTGLEEWDGNVNTPFWDNSLSGMYNLSGSPPFSLSPGDSLTYFKSFYIQRENAGSNYLGLEDSLFFYLELVNIGSGVILDTVNFWGVAPIDSLSVPNWINQDTSIIATYIMPDYGLEPNPSLKLKLRPVFKGDMNRLSLSRWDIAEPALLSPYMIAAKSSVQAKISEYLDSLSKRAAREDIGNPGIGFTIYPTVARDVLNVGLPDGVEARTLSLYSLTGAALKSVSVHQGQRNATMSISDLPVGRYYLAISNSRVIISVKIFEVKR